MIYRLHHKITILVVFLFVTGILFAQIPLAIKKLVKQPFMQGATFSLAAIDIQTKKVKYTYDADREVTPASILKLVTTSAALDLLGKDYQFETKIAYSGILKDSILNGNIYIIGSGDPTLGSSYIDKDPLHFINEWTKAIQEAGIKQIKGSIIADDKALDSEAFSTKWLAEDLGSYYATGCYGLNVFDNKYDLILSTKAPGTTPEIITTKPIIPNIKFYNHLTASDVKTDSSFIIGQALQYERYLYGIIPANKKQYKLKGDIPNPPLFLASFLKKALQKEGIRTELPCSCYNQLKEIHKWKEEKLHLLFTTYSPPLSEIIKIANHKSHNLYVESLCKKIGATVVYDKTNPQNQMKRGCERIISYWKDRGLNSTSLWMYDGSGISPINKVTASMMCKLLCKQYKNQVFKASLPTAGINGTISGFLKKTHLEMHAFLKSGSMHRVKSYAGYITSKKDRHTYAVTVIVNNYQGEGNEMRSSLEELLLQLF